MMIFELDVIIGPPPIAIPSVVEALAVRIQCTLRHSLLQVMPNVLVLLCAVVLQGESRLLASPAVLRDRQLGRRGRFFGGAKIGLQVNDSSK